MGRLPKANLRVGAVLTVPVAEKRVMVVQVVARLDHLSWYVAAYAETYDATSQIDLATAVEGVPIALALTSDVLVRHGEWKDVGDEAVDYSVVLLPATKVMVGIDRHVLCDYADEYECPITPSDAQAFPYRTDHAPFNFQQALVGYAANGALAGEDRRFEPVPRVRSSQAIFGTPSR